MMVNIPSRLQHPPSSERQQTDHHQPDQHAAKWLTKQRFKAAVAVGRLRRTLSCQNSKQPDNQINNTTSGITASCQ